MESKPVVKVEGWDTGNFSAVDLNAFFIPPPQSGLPSIQLGTISMLTMSTHRDKFPVSSLGRVGSKGYTAGHRTIGGTLTFNTIHREAFQELSQRTRGEWFYQLQPDDLPPFSIQIILVNDFGNMAVSMLEGVTILDSGTSFGLEQLTITETYSYMAQNKSPLKQIGDVVAVDPSAVSKWKQQLAEKNKETFERAGQITADEISDKVYSERLSGTKHYVWEETSITLPGQNIPGVQGLFTGIDAPELSPIQVPMEK